jgi:N-glycosylase/DNA lyase
LNAAASDETPSAACRTVFSVHDYDLAATLTSGQVFRWQLRDNCWEGVIGRRWLRLRAAGGSIVAETAEPASDWRWLADYLQIETSLSGVLATFPDDEPMRAAVAACRGLRLLRQDPWECLASFILSSTKQIVQIRQIVALLCERFGEPLTVPDGCRPAFAFPAPERIASAGEDELRACKMGFRAPNLRAAARKVAEGEVNLCLLAATPAAAARAELMRLPGVGRKIADCVLLFAYGFQDAFPVDVWVMKALQHFYFPRRRVALQRLQKFTASHFGPYAGYAQQYLFHYARVHAKLKE